MEIYLDENKHLYFYHLTITIVFHIQFDMCLSYLLKNMYTGIYNRLFCKMWSYYLYNFPYCNFHLQWNAKYFPGYYISFKIFLMAASVQFSSVAQLCLTLCDPMNCSTPGLPVHHQLLAFTQAHVHRVDDAIQPSHLLLSPSPPAPNPSQHQGLFQWVNSSNQVAKVLEFQFQHQSFQWTPRTDLL